MRSRAEEITQILHQAAAGNVNATAELLPMVYAQLRDMAGQLMQSERTNHTLQPTALVHEAFVKLMGQEVHWQNRGHFIAVASQAMRRILVDYARKYISDKRGGGKQRVALDHVDQVIEQPIEELLQLDEVLERLAILDAMQARLVELRFFGGLTIHEAAEVLKISPATVKREWETARAWLKRELDKG